MLLSKKTTVHINDTEANVIGHMMYAARKLWNLCNYERYNYKMLNMESAPTWYSQKKAYKDSIWYKSLPSQTAQQVCRVLDMSWKSFYTLKKTGGIENPRPPKYKQENIPITYVQKGFCVTDGMVRLTISKSLKAYMRELYAVDVNFLYLRNQCFKGINNMKQLMLYPPKNGEMDIIIVYEVSDEEMLPDNQKYLSIDIGVHNLMTCYDSTNGKSFILGREYFSIARKYDKELARVQSQWYKAQTDAGIKYPKTSKHIQSIHRKKLNCLNDYLHKLTHWLADYCCAEDIHTVIIGDITCIREDKNMGSAENQKFHALPYRKIYMLLFYKLARCGITLVMQNEAFSSQCSPLSPAVSKDYAEKEKRIVRGIFKDGSHRWNADAVGAYNILRLFLQGKAETNMVVSALRTDYPRIEKVAV